MITTAQSLTGQAKAGITAFLDLRSDTITRPTPAMRQAMAEAVVGDDQFGEDPTVNELEAEAARMLGKDAAVYVSSGTMGNLTAMLAHCGRGDEAIVGDESHIVWYESGGSAAVGGIHSWQIATDRHGQFDLDVIEAAIRPVRSGYPKTGVICVENTHNRCGGVVLSQDWLEDLRAIAERHGVPVHMDGARIFNAATSLGVPAADIARHASTVQFCLSKGLAAPVGSIVAGDSDVVERVRYHRKVLGGAMRQAGVIAAAGLVALTGMTGRLGEDHRRARNLALGLNAIDGITVDLGSVQSNIVLFRTGAASDQQAMADRLRVAGLGVSNSGTSGLRMVTHYEISDADIVSAIDIVADAMTDDRQRARSHAGT